MCVNTCCLKYTVYINIYILYIFNPLLCCGQTGPMTTVCSPPMTSMETMVFSQIWSSKPLGHSNLHGCTWHHKNTGCMTSCLYRRQDLPQRTEIITSHPLPRLFCDIRRLPSSESCSTEDKIASSLGNESPGRA